MPEQAKLSIVNYGFNIRSKSDMTAESQKEDDNMIIAARNIIKKHNFGKGAVMVTEAYHTDLANSNNYIYTSDNMDKLIKSFYDPFMTPFQCFHNDTAKPIGTNVNAKFFRKPIQLNRGVASGYGKLATFIPENSSFEGEPVIDLIQSRRFMAVSIGSKSSRSNMICTICGKSIFECDHMPGKVYEEAKCSIKILSPLFTECSMAGGNPADIDAMVRKMDCFDAEGTQTMESVIDMTNDPWSVAIYDNAVISQFPGVDIPDTENNKDSEDEMPNKSIAEVVTSYELIIANMKKDNEALALALVNANKTIAELQNKDQDNTQNQDQDQDQTDTDTDTNTDTENNDNTDTENNEQNKDTDTENTDTDTLDNKDKDQTDSDNKDTDSGKDDGTDNQDLDNKDQSSDDKGTDSQVNDTEKTSSGDLFRSMRNSKLSSSIHVVSRTYRV